MKVKTHQPIEGVGPEQVIEVAHERGEWLIANGYASETPDDGQDHLTDSGTKATAPDRLHDGQAVDGGKPQRRRARRTKEA